MDFNKPWTQFACDAEVEHYGTKRICHAHNNLQAEIERLQKKLDEARQASIWLSSRLTAEELSWVCETWPWLAGEDEDDLDL